MAEEHGQEALPDFLQELEAEMEAFIENSGLNSDTPEALSDRELLIDHYLHRISDLHVRATMNKELRNRQVWLQDAWLEEENGKLERAVKWLEEKILLNVPGNLLHFQDTFGVKTKSRTLPHGKVGFKSSRDTVEISNQVKALRWAEENDVEVKVFTELQKKPAIAYCQESGEIPEHEADGLEFVHGTSTRYVAANAD